MEILFIFIPLLVPFVCLAAWISAVKDELDEEEAEELRRAFSSEETREKTRRAVADFIKHRVMEDN